MKTTTKVRLRVFTIGKEKLYFLNVDYVFKSLKAAKDSEQDTHNDCELICNTLDKIAQENGMTTTDFSVIIPIVDYMCVKSTAYDAKTPTFDDQVPLSATAHRMIEITDIYKYLGDIKLNKSFADLLSSKNMVWGV
jgi:hypothetical protein